MINLNTHGQEDFQPLFEYSLFKFLLNLLLCSVFSSAMEKPPPNELLKKLLELEQSHEHLKQEMSRLKVSTELTQQSHSVSPYQPARRNIGEGAPARRKSVPAAFQKQKRIQDSINLRDGVGGIGRRSSAGKFTNRQYFNILQSISQSVHVFDLNMQIIFW